MKAEGRRPKAERRPKTETRNATLDAQAILVSGTHGDYREAIASAIGLRQMLRFSPWLPTFGLRPSDFGLLSAFGFRPSGFSS
jgi:hypothetical protein